MQLVLQLSRSIATCDSAMKAKVLKNLPAIADAVKVVGEGEIIVPDQKVLDEFDSYGRAEQGEGACDESGPQFQAARRAGGLL